MARLRASWQVFAGVIPEHIETNYTKSWFYTDEDYETDIKMLNEEKAANPPEGDKPDTVFTRYMKEAHAYAANITDPRSLNWVRVDFLWL